MEIKDHVAGLPQTLENLEKHFFLKKSLKTWKKSGTCFERFDTWKVWDFSSEIPFNPSSILSLSIRD